MAAPDVDLGFRTMNEAELRQWVEANPGRVDDTDSKGDTPLQVAVIFLKSVALIRWLVHKKGADVNAVGKRGYTPLQNAGSVEVFDALSDCGADPVLQTQESKGYTPLIKHVFWNNYEIVARLLRDPRVKASINVVDNAGHTALHIACSLVIVEGMPAIIQLLLQAGADLTVTDADGKTPLHQLQERHPFHPTTLTLPEESRDAEKASFLVKARRLVMAPSRGGVAVAPSFVQERMVRGFPLPDVGLAPVDGQRGRRRAPHYAGLGCGHEWRGHAAGRVSGGVGLADALLGSVAA